MTTETTFAYSSAKTAIEPVVEDRLRLTPAPHARQMDILFDATQYSAFPCVVRLEGDELLLSFRQAPRQSPIRHTHPRSVGTVLRSYDLGETWDAANATQLAAGGGGGVSKLYRGAGRVVGALAKHSVAPLHEAERAGLPPHPHEYPFAVEGTYWVWSDNWGLTWPLAYCSLVSTTVMSCAEPCALPDGTILLPTYGTNARAAIWSALLYRSIDDTHIAPEPTIMALGTPTRASTMNRRWCKRSPVTSMRCIAWDRSRAEQTTRSGRTSRSMGAPPGPSQWTRASSVALAHVCSD